MFLFALKIYEILQIFIFNAVKWATGFGKTIDPTVKPRGDTSEPQLDRAAQSKTDRFFRLRDPKNFLRDIAQAHEKFEQIKIDNKEAKIFWFHVASAGELEQAIPIARCFHEQLNAHIFLTYYSPSAESFLKKFPGLLMATGLPLDVMKLYEKANEYLPISKIFFVRYDIWPGLVYFAKHQNIELNLLCATHKKTKTGWFAALGQKFHLFLLKKFTHIFAVSQDDVRYFQTHLPKQDIVFTGDTKWWRAKERSQKLLSEQDSAFVRVFTYVDDYIKKNHLKCVVFGSPHAAEHDIALRCMGIHDSLLIIYVPHEVSEQGCARLVRQVQEKGGKPCLYTEMLKADGQSVPRFNVMIVDGVGHLAEFYALGNVAVIGGGFDGQIHNILESCAHGIPTLIGHNVERAPEAQTLIAHHAVLPFRTPNLLFQFLSHWVNLGGNMEQLRIVHEHAITLFKSIPNTTKIILNIFLNENLREHLQENKL